MSYSTARSLENPDKGSGCWDDFLSSLVTALDYARKDCPRGAQANLNNAITFSTRYSMGRHESPIDWRKASTLTGELVELATETASKESVEKLLIYLAKEAIGDFRQALDQKISEEGLSPLSEEVQESPSREAKSPLEEQQMRRAAENSKWLKENPGFRDVGLKLTYNEYGTPEVHVSINHSEYRPFSIVPVPDIFLECIRDAYITGEWISNKAKDDLGNIPSCPPEG